MPTQTDLVVKNASNVDKTFEAISSAAGDGGMALWYLEEGAISSAFPELTSVAQKKPTQRSMRLKLKVPATYVNSTTGQTLLGPFIEFDLGLRVPNDFPESGKDDAVAYWVNLQATPLIKSMLRSALSAT